MLLFTWSHGGMEWSLICTALQMWIGTDSWTSLAHAFFRHSGLCLQFQQATVRVSIKMKHCKCPNSSCVSALPSFLLHWHLHEMFVIPMGLGVIETEYLSNPPQFPRPSRWTPQTSWMPSPCLPNSPPLEASSESSWEGMTKALEVSSGKTEHRHSRKVWTEFQVRQTRDFPGGPVVKNLPSSAGVWSLVRELRSHRPQGNWTSVLQLLSPRALEPVCHN